MKHLFLLILLICSTTANAKKSFYNDCVQEDTIGKFSLILFNKIELINLGSCVGIAAIEYGTDLKLAESCKEVVEDKASILGMLTLSKAEAIQIGQCLGVIKYIHNKYHNEYVNNKNSYRNSREKYQCEKGMVAVNIIMKLSESKVSKHSLRDSLCH